MSLALMLTTLPSFRIKAYNEMTMQEWIEYNASIGIIEKITTEELIETISIKENLTTTEVMETYNLNPNVRNIYDNYVVKFPRTEYFGKNSTLGTTIYHEIYIKLYSSGSFREILHVYGSTLYSNNPEFTLSNIVPHTPAMLVSLNIKRHTFYRNVYLI